MLCSSWYNRYNNIINNNNKKQKQQPTTKWTREDFNLDNLLSKPMAKTQRDTHWATGPGQPETLRMLFLLLLRPLRLQLLLRVMLLIQHALVKLISNFLLDDASTSPDLQTLRWFWPFPLWCHAFDPWSLLIDQLLPQQDRNDHKPGVDTLTVLQTN